MSQTAIDRAGAEQARNAVRELLGWTDGKFAFHKGSGAGPVPRVTLEPGALVLDIFRERDEAVAP